jgi:hypothetical protein
MERLVAGALALALVAAALPTQAHADETPPLRFRDGRLLRDDLRSARGLKHAGIACTIIGTGMFVAGAAIFGSAYHGHPDQWTTANNAGGALMVVGGLGIIGGIPMWVIGGRAEERDQLRIGAALSGLVAGF